MVAVVRTTVVAAVVAAAVIFGVASAGAGPNLVPNGSFTDGCPVPSPCHWSADTANTTIGQSLVNFHTAPASLRMDVGSVSSAGALSDCFAIAPSTQYTIQGWYSTQSTALGGLGVELFEFADGACTVIADEAAAGAFPIVTTGAWTEVQTQATTDSTAHSAEARVQNFSGMFSTRTVFYDDIAVGTSPLAVTVVSFTAHRAGKGVPLRWRTGTEVNELGFNIYRQRNGHRVRVNRRLIPALSVTRGSVAGGAYSHVDRRAPRHAALRYWLQEVETSGHRAWHGPVRVGPA